MRLVHLNDPLFDHFVVRGRRPKLAEAFVPSMRYGQVKLGRKINAHIFRRFFLHSCLSYAVQSPSGNTTMQRKRVYSTLVPDTLAMIAACTNSRPVMELAVALRSVVSGALLLPSDRGETILRITRDLMNPEWNLRAHITLRDPILRYWAKMFWRTCIQAVPLTAENPTRDLVWQSRVKAELVRNASLQNHAKLLLRQITLRVTPAQPVVAPVIAAKVDPAPQYDNAELEAKARQFVEEFIRLREAQKARIAAATAATPANPPAEATNAEQPPEPPPAAEPVFFGGKRRLLRNVAIHPRYSSMPSLLGLAATSTTPTRVDPRCTSSILS